MDAAATVRAGVDIGGTFTDVVLTLDTGRTALRKQLSSPEDYSHAVIDGIRAASEDLGLEPERIRQIIHATTVATNAILEHKGARCALITTEGFRDVLEIGRLRIPELYNLFYDKRPLLIPRRHIFEVRERIDCHGAVLEPLDAASVAAAVERIGIADIESVAVCLINSYANPTHEQAVVAALAKSAPEIEISGSADIVSQIGEYERTSTAVINAFIKPKVRGYLNSLRNRLDGETLRAPLYVMQSGGGLATLDQAAARPVGLIESGPAAGVLATEALAAATARSNVISFDVGGTSAKASIIERGRVLRTREYEVGGAISATSRLTGGGGYPINLPVVDIAEVGAGGGSIARIDDGGSLRVGPRSAGAIPGPACYGSGGTLATVTDANVVLGYINPTAIAGGTIAIHPKLAALAIEEHVAAPLGLDLLRAAHGIHLIANSQMMGAIRAVTTQRGRDLREFTLIAFGGSGPVHAAELARMAGIDSFIVPRAPGLFSTFGLLTTELTFDQDRTLYADADAMDPATLNRTLGSLRDAVVSMAGDDGPDLSLEIAADLHYWGQSSELTVTCPYKTFTKADIADVVERFEVEHQHTHGHRAEDERVTLVAVRVIGRTASIADNVLKLGPANGSGQSAPRRRTYWGPDALHHDTAVIGRDDLTEQARLGPLLIEEYDSVTVVPPDASAQLDRVGNIVVQMGPRAEALAP